MITTAIERMRALAAGKKCPHCGAELVCVEWTAIPHGGVDAVYQCLGEIRHTVRKVEP